MRILIVALIFGCVVAATSYGVHLIKAGATAQCEARFNEQKARGDERVKEIYSKPSRSKLELVAFLRTRQPD